eukprot:6474840-Amphidinium_carterae.1
MQQILSEHFEKSFQDLRAWGVLSPIRVKADPDRCRWFIQGGGSRAGESGGSRSRSRSRDKSVELFADNVADLYFSEWNIPWEESTGEQRVVHVSVEDKVPHTISVPFSWSTQDLQWMIARHMGMHERWLEFTWVSDDVHIGRSAMCPILQDADNLLKCGDAFPRHALTLNTFTNKLELPMGCCKHNRGKLTSASLSFGDLVRDLAAAVAFIVPEVVFNAMLLVVTPGGAKGGNDSFFHAAAHEVVLVPYGDCSTSWVWFADSAGVESMEVDGTLVMGTWIPFDKVTCLTASSIFALHAPEGSGGILVYKQAIEYFGELIRDLARLGFPLDDADLNRLDVPEPQLGSQSVPQVAQVNPNDVHRLSGGSQGLGAMVRRTPIGAPSTRKELIKPRSSAGTGSTDPDVTTGAQKATMHSVMDFELWVRNKLQSIEDKQSTLLAEVRKLQRAAISSSSHVVDPRPAIGGRPKPDKQGSQRRSWKEGGAKRGRSNPAQDEETVFATPPSYASHGLFAAGLFLATIDINMEALITLRQSIAYWMRQAANTGSTIAGLSMEGWAQQFGYTVRDYLRHTDSPPFRMGNQLDGFLIALVLGLSVWMADDSGELLMCSHFARPRFWVVQGSNGQCHVAHLPVETQVLSFCFAERITELPLELLSEPRTSEMRSAMSRHDRDTRMDVPLITQYFHTHMAQHGAHMRLFLMVPAFNYVEVQSTPIRPEMTLILEGMVIRREVPSWTAVARILVEIDTATVDVDALVEIYHTMDVVIHNRIEVLISDLLEPVRLEYKQAASTAVQLLDLAMTHSVRTFGRFAHKFPFLVVGVTPGQVKTERCSFPEFIQACRMAGCRSTPGYVIADGLSVRQLAKVSRPLLVLREDQVAGAKAALRYKFEEEITEVKWEHAHGPVQPTDNSNSRSIGSTISPTLPFFEHEQQEDRNASALQQSQAEDGFLEGGGPKVHMRSTASPKQPAQAVDYSKISTGQRGEVCDASRDCTPSEKSKSDVQDSILSSPVDDSFEDLWLVSMGGKRPNPEHCTEVSYVDRQAPFHVHMLTQSPPMGYRVHHPPAATVFDVRHTMARRLKMNLQRIVLAVGDGKGGEIPVHDSTVAADLGTLYIQ